MNPEIGAERYFYDDKLDRIIVVTQGPCPCHPFDLIVEVGKQWNEAFSLGFQSQKEIDEYLKHWEEL